MLFVVLISSVVAVVVGGNHNVALVLRAIVVGRDHVVALASRCDACGGSKVLHVVAGSEVVVVVDDAVEHSGNCSCCRSRGNQDLFCLLVRVAKWGMAVGLRAFRRRMR